MRVRFKAPFPPSHKLVRLLGRQFVFDSREVDPTISQRANFDTSSVFTLRYIYSYNTQLQDDTCTITTTLGGTVIAQLVVSPEDPEDPYSTPEKVEGLVSTSDSELLETSFECGTGTAVFYLYELDLTTEIPCPNGSSSSPALPPTSTSAT